MEQDVEVPREVMDGIGIDLVRELSYALGTHFKTGDLLNSIQYRVEGNKIIITALPYWEYVEYGTPGILSGVSSSVDGHTVAIGANPSRKMPVKKDGDKFINYITGEEDFALAKHIQLYGTQPYPFVRPVMYHKARGIVAKNIKSYYSRHGLEE